MSSPLLDPPKSSIINDKSFEILKLFSKMGLRFKQVSGDGFGWCKTLQVPSSPPTTTVIGRQRNQSEPVKCPRCDSANTKFCYFNNYNNSQPRHFCRACKRHWTKGGTLRNVPVGGGRKNKRLKKSSSTGRRMVTDQFTVQIHNQRQNFPLLSHGDGKNSSELPHQGMLHPPASPPVLNSFNSGNLDGINYGIDHHGLFLGSDSLPSCSFLSSSSLYQSSNIYNYAQDQVKTTISVTHPTHLSSNTSSVMEDMANYWNWEDMNSLVATDLNLRWEDSYL